MKLESEIQNNTGDDVEVGEAKKENKPENKYDQEVSDNEMESFQKEIEEKVRIKAEELGISKEELIEVSGLDLENLEAEKLKELSLRRGEFDFIKDSIDTAINEFQKSDKPNIVLKDVPSTIDKLLKFAREHKKVVGVGQLMGWFCFS